VIIKDSDMMAECLRPLKKLLCHHLQEHPQGQEDRDDRFDNGPLTIASKLDACVTHTRVLPCVAVSAQRSNEVRIIVLSYDVRPLNHMPLTRQKDIGVVLAAEYAGRPFAHAPLADTFSHLVLY
jgi:hypothetical protein